jgi:hypothetical protein
MSELVFLLEEPSARALLEGLLPRILPSGWDLRFLVFEGKQDLDKQMVRKIRGYRTPGARFVVLRDQDSGDCMEIREELAGKCCEAGRSDTLIRIACRELESWFLADLSAVERGLEQNKLAKLQGKNPYRSPDSFCLPSQRLAELAPCYQKLSGSRAIGPHLDLNNSRSKSFMNFILGLRRICSGSMQ